MFASRTLARRVEAAEAALTLECAAEAHAAHPERGILALRLCGGVGAYAGGSPFDKVIGVGFGPLDASGLAAFERAVHARGGTVQVELSTLAEPSVASELTDRGYRLIGFENVLGLPLDGAAAVVQGRAVDGVAVEPALADALDAWIGLMADGFSHPDVFDGPASHESFPREAIVQVMRETAGVSGTWRFFALRGGVRAGGASMRLFDGVAQLTGAATLPVHRRRGVQTALLRARLDFASRAGCDVAVVTTQPGSVSQENVMRAGFALLYARAVLALAPR